MKRRLAENTGKEFYRQPPRKKILLLAKSGGFVPQFCLENVRLLRELGYEIYYAADFLHPVYGLREKELKELKVKKIQISVSDSPLKVWRHLRELEKLKKWIVQEEISCVHCHTPVGGFLGRMLGRFFGKNLKVIYTAHGFHFCSKAPWYNWIFYPAEAWMARYTDALITINREDFKRAGRFQLRPGGKVYRISGAGVDFDRLRVDKEAGGQWRKKHQIPTDAFHLIAMGELNKNKNHGVLLDALACLQTWQGREKKNVYCSIAGEGSRRKLLEKKIAALGLADRVRLVGYQENAGAFLGSGDVFLFPSRREGLGMAALEAMAAGLPVVAADNRGSREYLTPGINGYLCRWNRPKEFAQAILRLYRNPGLRREMGREAERTARRFSGEKVSEIMRKIYKKHLKDLYKKHLI